MLPGYPDASNRYEVLCFDRERATGFRTVLTADAEASGTPSESGLPAAERPVIAIVSTDKADSAWLVDIAEALGFDAECYLNTEAFEAAGITPCAVIVCFRVATATTRVPVLPPGVRGCRLLVMSDLLDEQHIVDTLDAGAHHLFTFGESARITAARIHAGLRRHDPLRNRSIEVSPFTFELAHRRVTLEDSALDLSPKEFDLAFYLFSNRGRVVTNGELLTSVWSLPQDIDTRRIDTAACRVRKKMSLGQRTGWVLRRFRREGYGLYWDSRDIDVPVPAAEERRDNE